MKLYIAGKITDNPDYKQQFKEAEEYLKQKGHTTMNPAVLPAGFEHHQYMEICYKMIDACDGIYLLRNWQDSKGAKMENEYARKNGKTIWHEAFGVKFESTYLKSIIARFGRQKAKGINKYGKPLEQNDREVVEAMEYLAEELTDALMYLEEVKEKLQTNSGCKRECQKGDIS